MLVKLELMLKLAEMSPDETPWYLLNRTMVAKESHKLKSWAKTEKTVEDWGPVFCLPGAFWALHEPKLAGFATFSCESEQLAPSQSKLATMMVGPEHQSAWTGRRTDCSCGFGPH